MTRCAPGITLPAISRERGAAATHGELSSRSKYTAPVRRTARSTSERTSAFTTLRGAGRTGIQTGRASRSIRLVDERLNNSDVDTWLSPGAAPYRRDTPRDEAPATLKG